MRESIGGLSLFQIVIVFLLLFTAIMCFTINHSRAFAVKDEVVSIIENNALQSGSITNATIDNVIERLGEVGYRTFGDCTAGGTDFDWVGYGGTSDTNALFCLKTVEVPEELREHARSQCGSKCDILSGPTDYPHMIYYNIKLFYRLDVPVLERFDFNVVSSTRVIYAQNVKVPGCKWGVGSGC